MIIFKGMWLLVVIALLRIVCCDGNTFAFSKTQVLCPPVSSSEHIHSSYHQCRPDAFHLLLLPESWTNIFGKYINGTEYHEIATMVQEFQPSSWYKRNDVHWRTVNYTLYVEGLTVRFMEIQDVSNFTNGILFKTTTVPLDLHNEEAYVQENVFCIVKYRGNFVMDVFSNFSLINPNYASEWFANSMLNVYSRYVNTFSLVLDHYCLHSERFRLPKLEFSTKESPSLYTESEEHENQRRKMLTTKSASYEESSRESLKESTKMVVESPQKMSVPQGGTSCELASYTAHLINFAIVFLLFLAVLTICVTIIVWAWSRRRQLDLTDLQTVVASRRSSHLLQGEKETILLTI